MKNGPQVHAYVCSQIADLKKEKADDVKMKDFCIEALHKNEVAQEMKKRDIEQMEAKIADLTATIDTLAKQIAALQAEIAEMQVQLKRAGEDRELENKDFQQVVRAFCIIAILKENHFALDRKERPRYAGNAMNSIVIGGMMAYLRWRCFDYNVLDVC